MAVVGLLLAFILLTGTFLSEHYPQAAQAQSTGFDALAHSIFDGALADQDQVAAR
jgi:hypothetical protein